MSIVLTYFLRIMGVMGSSVNYGSDGKIGRIGLIGLIRLIGLFRLIITSKNLFTSFSCLYEEKSVISQ